MYLFLFTNLLFKLFSSFLDITLIKRLTTYCILGNGFIYFLRSRSYCFWVKVVSFNFIKTRSFRTIKGTQHNVSFRKIPAAKKLYKKPKVSFTVLHFTISIIKLVYLPLFNPWGVASKKLSLGSRTLGYEKTNKSVIYKHRNVFISKCYKVSRFKCYGIIKVGNLI